MEVDWVGIGVYLTEDVRVVFAEAGGEIHCSLLK